MRKRVRLEVSVFWMWRNVGSLSLSLSLAVVDSCGLLLSFFLLLLLSFPDALALMSSDA